MQKARKFHNVSPGLFFIAAQSPNKVCVCTVFMYVPTQVTWIMCAFHSQNSKALKTKRGAFKAVIDFCLFSWPPSLSLCPGCLATELWFSLTWQKGQKAAQSNLPSFFLPLPASWTTPPRLRQKHFDAPELTPYKSINPCLIYFGTPFVNLLRNRLSHKNYSTAVFDLHTAEYFFYLIYPLQWRCNSAAMLPKCVLISILHILHRKLCLHVCFTWKKRNLKFIWNIKSQFFCHYGGQK